MPGVGSAVRAVGLCGTLVLAGCTGLIGPDFVTPEAPAVARITRDPVPARTASGDQAFQVGANVPGKWWELFGSQQLNRIVEEVLAVNPSLQSAQLALERAQETAKSNNLQTLLPSVTVPSIQVTDSSSSLFSVNTGNLRVSYSVDVCCGAARSRDSTAAQLQSQEVALKASYISMTANVVNTVINLGVAQAQRRATAQSLDIQRQLATIAQEQLRLGDISVSEAAEVQSQVTSSELQLAQIDRNIAQQQTQLGVYLGKFPSEVEPISVNINEFRLPSTVPVSLPAQLVAQRPDIVQGVYTLRQATDTYDISIANLLPQISISGSFTPAGLAWNFAASLVQAAINIPATVHRNNAAELALQQAGIAYETTVLNAFVDVANALAAVEYDARAYQVTANSTATSRNNLSLAQQQYDLGVGSYAQVLKAQQSYGNASYSLTSAKATRLRDMVALYVALGGGWWESAATTATASR